MANTDVTPAGHFLYEAEMPTIERGGEQPSPYPFSEGFWLNHFDVLPEDKPAMIAQLGEVDGQLVQPDDPRDRVMTVVFDSSHRYRNRYMWQLTIAETYGPRSVYQTAVTPRSATTLRRNYDQQGRAEQRRPEEVDAQTIMPIVVALAGSHLVAKATAEYRAQMSKMESKLQHLSVEGLLKFSNGTYDQKIKDAQDAIDRCGFSATSLEVLGLTPIVRPRDELTLDPADNLGMGQ